jgi:hypothetical protein
MKLCFDGKVAVVTGGAMGIAVATAQLHGQLGDHAELIQSGECMHVPAVQIIKFLSGGGAI